MEIIHQLAVQDLSHSKLQKRVYKWVASGSSFDRILEEVAVFQQPDRSRGGQYQLRG